MLFRNVVILDDNFKPRAGACVGIKDGVICHIGGYAEGYGEEYDCTGLLMAPAFCSAHSHNAMVLLRGAGTDLPLQRWLNEAVFPKEAQLTGRDIYNGTLAACAEMLKYGVASSNDMYIVSGKDMIRAYRDAGIKANVSVSVVCFDPSDPFINRPEIRMYEELFSEVGANDGDIRVDCSVHAEYTNTENSVRAIAELANRHGAGFHVHISETKAEHAACIERRGMTPVRFMEKCGAFENRVIAAHCVYCSDDDYALMAEKGAFMASCPTSNLKLGSGIPDYSRSFKNGVTVCLGTDGVASNNNLNMLKEAKLMALLAKGYACDPTICTAAQALKAATRTGWLSQGRADSGLIKEGMRADLALFRIDTVNTKPSPDEADTLLYSCDGEAYMTVVNGKILYKDGEYFTIDTEKLKYEIGE